MYSARQFGIEKNEGCLKTFMSNDWMHGVLVNHQLDEKIKTIATLILGSQLVISTIALMYFQHENDSSHTAFAMYTLLYAIMCLSNATKNQKDVFSRYMQSYCHKMWMTITVIIYAVSQMQIVFMLLAGIYAFDALFGLMILKQVFTFEKVEYEIDNEQAYAPLYDEHSNVPKRYNNRLPETVTRSNMGKRMFSWGWKFNMFNEFDQSNKTVAAISVITAQFFFSLASLVMLDKEHQSLSLIVFIYAIICLFSFINVTYVRDFDALQVNFTPLMLSVCGIVTLMRTYDFLLLGMVLSLIADLYFAIRYKENSDKIQFSVIERFAMESWTQEAFNKVERVTLQYVAITIITMQIYLTLVGTHKLEKICMLFFVYYMVRLVQFLLETNLAVNMAQSNFVNLCLAVMGVFALFSQEMTLMTTLSCSILILDAFIGTAIFVEQNQEDIYKELGLHKEYKTYLKPLNCEGHIANLKMTKA